MKNRKLLTELKEIIKLIISFFTIIFITTCIESTEPFSKENFVIAIDIGHSIKRCGAISSRGIGEYYFNKNLAKLLQNNLIQQGYIKTFLINENGTDIPLVDRANIAKKKNSNILLSINHDSVQPQYLSSWIYKEKKYFYCDLFRGYSIFYSNENSEAKKSLAFAQLLGTELLNNDFVPSLHHAEKIKGENRELISKEKGIYRFDDLIILKKSKMPSVLLECGIILNRDEEILLNTLEYQKVLVLSIVSAINKVCEFNWNVSIQ